MSETLTFCVLDPLEPFICEIHGKFCIDTLREIEAAFPDEWADSPVVGAETVTYKVSTDPVWNHEHGHVEGHEWVFEQVSMVPVAPLPECPSTP